MPSLLLRGFGCAAADDGGAYAGRRGTDDSASLVSALSRQPGQEPAAGLPLELTAASAEKEGRRLSSLASPARSERQRLIPAWKPTDEARQGSRSGGPSGPTPRPGGVHPLRAGFAYPSSHVGLCLAATSRITATHSAGLKRDYSWWHVLSTRLDAAGSAQKPRAAWGGGPRSAAAAAWLAPVQATPSRPRALTLSQPAGAHLLTLQARRCCQPMRPAIWSARPTLLIGVRHHWRPVYLKQHCPCCNPVSSLAITAWRGCQRLGVKMACELVRRCSASGAG